MSFILQCDTFVLVCTLHWEGQQFASHWVNVFQHNVLTCIQTDRHTYRQYTPYQPNQPLPSQPKPNYTQLTNHTHLGVAAPQKKCIK